ncbi:helicase [Dokdonia sinensis]|uniref:Helicase n=1 Tax=Dokdonia sinensis TaxID=2479847 RepID=A0A3M0G7V9_9FLAO|nr:primase-helicase family protein [Dokdonia sinensis]RMB58482.1 helicase [Dokdonia sinensis]
MEYLRIGTEYYKKVEKPTASGNVATVMLPWKKQTILDDHDKDYLLAIPKYEGFGVYPSHINYVQVKQGFYNKYKKLSHSETPIATSIATNIAMEQTFVATVKFLEHIFGNHYLLGMDYLTILYQKPLQILPILCLVSSERNTGKTTFLNWLKLLFEENMTINKNEDFRSRFNSDWSEKLIIAIDEVLLDKKEDSERIKNLSTAANFKTESKGKDKVESDFFGKFILCSNNEDNFILIDKQEIRYWVIKVNPLENSDPNLFKKLALEVTHFASYLRNRIISTPKMSRMWFTKEQIHTEALNKLVQGTKYYAERELKALLLEMLDDFETDVICLTVKEILELCQYFKYKISRTEINRIMQSWSLESTNSSYRYFYKSINPADNEWQVSSTTRKGRFYTFEKKYLENC